MNTSLRFVRAALRLASLTLAASALLGGCAVDPDEVLRANGQAIFSYTIPQHTVPREYIGPVNACPAGQVRVHALCFRECGYGYVPTADGWCGSGWQEAAHPMVCAADQEYINGSCYRPCASGCQSQGILGCLCGGSSGPTPGA